MTHALIWSMPINALLALVVIFVVCRHMGEVEDVATAVYPLMLIFQTATDSSTVASVLIGCFLVINATSGAGSLASASRITWAWARDGALPRCFATVDSKRRVPVSSIWLPTVVVMVLSLLNLANSWAFAIIISLSLFGLYLSYALTIGCMLYARWKGRNPSKETWSLGKWGPLINMYAVFHSIFLGIFAVLPTGLPINASNMNYALPITIGVGFLIAAGWFGWGRKHWTGLDERTLRKFGHCENAP